MNRFDLYTCQVGLALGQDSPTRHSALRLPPEAQLPQLSPCSKGAAIYC